MHQIKSLDSFARVTKRSAAHHQPEGLQQLKRQRVRKTEKSITKDLRDEKKEALVVGHSMLTSEFFQRPSLEVAKDLVGKVVRVYYAPEKIWLSAQIIESEAYELREKGSHSNAHGNTPAKRALFMSPGTIYMYYARGKDSFNCSCGNGNACLIKSGIPYTADLSSEQAERMIEVMHRLNPIAQKAKSDSSESGRRRETMRLCSGQTLLCSSLGLKVTDWNQKVFDKDRFWLEDVGYRPENLIQTTRLGIPKGRDEHLPYRWVDEAYAAYCTANPLKSRGGDSKKPKKKN